MFMFFATGWIAAAAAIIFDVMREISRDKYMRDIVSSKKEMVKQHHKDMDAMTTMVLDLTNEMRQLEMRELGYEKSIQEMIGYDGSEHCIVCGEPIPEGRQVCLTHLKDLDE